MMGADRINVGFTPGPLARHFTDGSGMALVEELPTGVVPFDFGADAVDVQVVQERELYDVVVAVHDGAPVHVIAPVRYPIGAEVQVLAAGSDIGAAAAVDGTILLLEPGSYPGGFELRSDGGLIFGAWSQEEGPLSTIEGDVTVLGGSNRIRGVNVTGRVTSAANAFSMAFSRVGAASITGNGVSLLRNEFTAGAAAVPSSNAVLVDNVGIP